VEIGINWSWVVVFGLVVWSLGAAVFPDQNPGLSDSIYLTMAVIAALAFFVSLLLHELGHAVQARRDGMEIEGITLWLFGGVARFKGMFPSAGAELRIALAGPAVSLLLGVVFTVTAKLASLPTAVDGVVTWLGRINLILLVFNMLPALPLDGGRVFRALAWQVTGDFAKATRTAGGVGRAIGNAMVVGGILLAFLYGAPGGVWLALIGWFLSAAATAESRYAEISSLLGDLTVRDAMVREPVTAPAGMTIDRFIDDVHAPHRYASYPVVAADGSLAGLVTFTAAAAIPAARRPQVTVADVALSSLAAATVDADSPLGEATFTLTSAPAGRALVTTEDGRLAGLLSVTDVSRLLQLRQSRSRESSRSIPAARGRRPGVAA
jgi:Zn-dependent protease